MYCISTLSVSNRRSPNQLTNSIAEALIASEAFNVNVAMPGTRTSAFVICRASQVPSVFLTAMLLRTCAQGKKESSATFNVVVNAPVEVTRKSASNVGNQNGRNLPRRRCKNIRKAHASACDVLTTRYGCAVRLFSQGVNSSTMPTL